MKDLGLHLLLFGLAGTVVVVIGTLFSEPDDRAALRALPRRLLVFFAGCAVVAGVMLLLEHTVASVH